MMTYDQTGEVGFGISMVVPGHEPLDKLFRAPEEFRQRLASLRPFYHVLREAEPDRFEAVEDSRKTAVPSF